MMAKIKRIYGNETIPPEKDLILRSAKTLKKYSRTASGIDIGVIKKIPTRGWSRWWKFKCGNSFDSA